MEKKSTIFVVLPVALLCFCCCSLLQVVDAQIRSQSEVFTDVTEYLTTVADSVFPAHPDWPEELKTSLQQVVTELNKWKDSPAAAGDYSRMDQPSFLLHRR